MSIEIECAHVTEVFTGFGQKGVLAENVALDAAEQAARYLETMIPHALDSSFASGTPGAMELLQPSISPTRGPFSTSQSSCGRR